MKRYLPNTFFFRSMHHPKLVYGQTQDVPCATILNPYRRSNFNWRRQLHHLMVGILTALQIPIVVPLYLYTPLPVSMYLNLCIVHNSIDIYYSFLYTHLYTVTLDSIPLLEHPPKHTLQNYNYHSC